MSVMSRVLTGNVLLFCYDCRMTELLYLSVASLTIWCEVTGEFMTLWEFSRCWCAADYRFRGLMCSYELSTWGLWKWWRSLWEFYPNVSVCEALGIPRCFFGHLELLFWWTDAPGGWRDTCAGFQRNEFWWMFWFKMGSDQNGVEVSVVASSQDESLSFWMFC